jgi:hypothetical protein
MPWYTTIAVAVAVIVAVSGIGIQGQWQVSGSGSAEAVPDGNRWQTQPHPQSTARSSNYLPPSSTEHSPAAVLPAISLTAMV